MHYFWDLLRLCIYVTDLPYENIHKVIKRLFLVQTLITLSFGGYWRDSRPWGKKCDHFALHFQKFLEIQIIVDIKAITYYSWSSPCPKFWRYFYQQNVLLLARFEPGTLVVLNFFSDRQSKTIPHFLFLLKSKSLNIRVWR